MSESSQEIEELFDDASGDLALGELEAASQNISGAWSWTQDFSRDGMRWGWRT